jgi:hypothetical protein
MATRDSDGKFDWSRTWVADMFMSSEEAVKHQAEIERLQGITPEVKRLREIKAGVITASAGFGLMILLFVLMNGIIAGGRVSDAAAEILSRIWVVGIIPVLVGAALIFNGTFISRRIAKPLQPGTDRDTSELEAPAERSYLPSPKTNELVSGVPFSVVDETTRHLPETPRKRH